ncbi:hypothetical protein Tco_1540384 [Tanacetum coccineum]
MNETTIRPPAAITSAKVAANLGLQEALVVELDIVEGREYRCLDQEEAAPQSDQSVDGIGDKNSSVIHGPEAKVVKDDNGINPWRNGFDGVPGGFSRSRVGADHPFPKRWRKDALRESLRESKALRGYLASFSKLSTIIGWKGLMIGNVDDKASSNVVSGSNNIRSTPLGIDNVVPFGLSIDIDLMWIWMIIGGYGVRARSQWRILIGSNCKPDKVNTIEHNAGEDDNMDGIAMGKDLEIGVPRNSDKVIELYTNEVTEPKTANNQKEMLLKVWRGKWGPLVAESGESGGWEEEVRWCDGGGRG